MDDCYLDTFSCSNPKLPIPLSPEVEPQQGVTGEPPPLIPTAYGGALSPLPVLLLQQLKAVFCVLSPWVTAEDTGLSLL